MLVTLRKHGDTAGLISPQRKALSENAAFCRSVSIPENAVMNKQAPTPRYYVVAPQIWEYFSFMVCAPLLILFISPIS